MRALCRRDGYAAARYMRLSAVHVESAVRKRRSSDKRKDAVECCQMRRRGARRRGAAAVVREQRCAAASAAKSMRVEMAVRAAAVYARRRCHGRNIAEH